MKRSGHADLPLHYGTVPPWLANRMTKLGRAITESIIIEYGRAAFIKRMSDPLWFQSLGAVMGMDWHSSGITTSVIGALKKAINPISKELGLYVCGGRGKYSRATPQELLKIASQTGLDGNELVRSSRLSAKVDNTAIQDGFSIYLHSFFLTREGEWSVVQQGMNGDTGYARRYHWHSEAFSDFLNEPHSAVIGYNQGEILNLTAPQAQATKTSILNLTREKPELIQKVAQRYVMMPSHHDVKAKDIDLKRLGATLALAHDTDISQFDELLLLKGVGPRTLQSLTLVSEVIHGTPSRFTDPARFSFAHGGKDGNPFPVPLKVYDETLSILKVSLEKAKIGHSDRVKAIKNLSKISQRMEKSFQANTNFEQVIAKERAESHKYGGMTVLGKAKKPLNNRQEQLSLF
ncbi:DUF763 domain-containing protein [Roseivirga misakiensis]|uniref:DUF763 domain-containing protein n=1 Tax=Roseivirga misakiensis TaxID=1563681 RepID=A0A1E5SZJ8_9BACT|nr:DUF763 domain-containing protein [Roseivirga misakiensis]OEK04558.1 hypothetical protein BFP71_13920 [Roseivirga misakiensis]